MDNRKETYPSQFKVIVLSIGITFLAIVVELYTTFIGKVVSIAFPCQDAPTNSAPCYLKYDLIGTIVLSAILIVLIISLLITLNRKSNKNSK